MTSDTFPFAFALKEKACLLRRETLFCRHPTNTASPNRKEPLQVSFSHSPNLKKGDL
jgi:hypothetical protein